MPSDPKSWKIAIVGSGALGGYYGAKLAQAGYQVHFLLRSDYEEVRQHGLTVKSPGGNIHLPQVNAHASTEDIGPCDVVLIGLKTTGNDALARLIPPLLGPETALVTLQNGLGNEELLATQFGEQRVIGGLCFVCLNRVAPGVIEHYGHGTLSLGEFRRAPQSRTKALANAFRESGIETHVVENLVTERWRKLVWNIPFNGLSIAARANVEEVLGNPALEKLARTLMEETITGAAALGHKIPGDFIEFQIERSAKMGPYRPSSMIDFFDGRTVEVESIWGEPLRQAQKAGAHLPQLEMLYALLQHLNPR